MGTSQSSEVGGERPALIPSSDTSFDASGTLGTTRDDGDESAEGEEVSDEDGGEAKVSILKSVDVTRGRRDFEAYYTSQALCAPPDWSLALERLRAPLPPAFRILSCTDGVEAALLDKLATWQPEQVDWCPGAYRLRSVDAFGPGGQCDTTLNKVLISAQRAGHISRQETASMLPVAALGIEPHHRVLELCAAPGSKTMQILDLQNSHEARKTSRPPSGLLVANDYKELRLDMLIERAKRIPSPTLLVTCADARSYPDIESAKTGQRLHYDRILCDVPCSGDGTVRKALGLLSQWTPQAGLAHHGLQLSILLRGLALLGRGGVLAYSTCALNPVECEAVVAAALWESGGAFELMQVSVPGLRLEAGLTSWRVPLACTAPSCNPEGAETKLDVPTFSSWDEVPESEKHARLRLKRSMFPPSAYAAPASKAEAIVEQLQRCARLLPAHDDGGCFFLALFRHKDGSTTSWKKGDNVIVRHQGLEAVVREPRATGKFAGLVRVAYLDGSRYHASPEDLEPCVVPSTTPLSSLYGSKADAITSTGVPQGSILIPATDADWSSLANFYGLEDGVEEAAAAGVVPFPRSTLFCLPRDGAVLAGEILCTASSTLRDLKEIPSFRAAGRPAFIDMTASAAGDGTQVRDDEGWPQDAFQWRPTLEFAPTLVRYCTRRVIRAPSDATLTRFLTSGQLSAAELNIDGAWEAGPCIVVPAAATLHADGEEHVSLAYVGLLHCSRVRLVTQKGWRLNYGPFAQPSQYDPGSNFRCGQSARTRWVPPTRRCAR